MQKERRRGVVSATMLAFLMLFFHTVLYMDAEERQENRTQKAFPYRGNVFFACLRPETDFSQMERDGSQQEAEKASRCSIPFLPIMPGRLLCFRGSGVSRLAEVGYGASGATLLLMTILGYIMRQDGKKRVGVTPLLSKKNQT